MQKAGAGMSLDFKVFEEKKMLECSEGWQWGE